jgi:hypothetical protein
MPDWWAAFTANPALVWVAVCALGILVAVGVYATRLHLRRRPTPEELERRRRASLHRTGKMGDGEIVDVEAASASIVYSYSVAGVVYTASQDLMALQSLLPTDAMTMVGPVSVKFDPRNPANSIVLCEDWSGLRNRTRSGVA